MSLNGFAETRSTSPSIYVRFPIVSASDACGLIGSASTSITLAFSPGELSTFEWELYMRTSTQTFTKVLDTADLPCGPWNGTDKFLPEPWSNYSSYQPLIVLPSKLIDMVPAWRSCTADMFEGQDPPRTLAPAAAMVPAPTKADTHAQKSVASPSPSIPALPLKSGAGHSQPADPGPTPNPPSTPNDPSPSVGDPGDPGDLGRPNLPSKPNDPSTDDPKDSSDDKSPLKPNDPSKGHSEDPSNGDSHTQPNDAPKGDPGDPNGSQDSSHDVVSSVASLISNPTQTIAEYPAVNGHSDPSAADSKDTKNTQLALPPAVALQGHTITQGAAPVTISDTPVVYQSGSISAGGEIKAVPTGWGQSNQDPKSMIVGGLTFSAVPSAAKAESGSHSSDDYAANGAKMNDPPAKSPNPATYITVGSETIAVDANGISVAGTILKPGSPGITIDGTPISLGSSIFVVGSRTELLSPYQPTLTAQPSYITVGDQIMSVGSSAVIINGKTLKPADPGITVDGTLVSLGSSILVIGSHTQNLILPRPTLTASSSYITVGGETIAVAATGIVVSGHTMTPGGPAVTADGKLVSLGSSILVIGTQTVSFTLPTASAGTSTSEGIGAMIMKGLGEIGASTVAVPIQTAGKYNGTWGGNGVVLFLGGAKKNGALGLSGWIAWLWTVLTIMI